MLPLFITIDTEGDSLWDNPETIKTENSLYIPRFQELCEEYRFKPIWLTDYEMAMDERYTDYICKKAKNNLCEVGIHVHARNNPPVIELQNQVGNGGAYLIEYPSEIMRRKFLNLKNILEKKTGLPIVTHRAGRWTLNQDYLDILIDTGIKYDCSVTPGISWYANPGMTSGSHGSDWYSDTRKRSLKSHSDKMKYIIEYPVSIIKRNSFFMPDEIRLYSIMRAIKNTITKKNIWLRPNGNNLCEMKYVLRTIAYAHEEYAMFMIHSSELMPGGSPTFNSNIKIERMYFDVEQLFKYAVSLGYHGATFEEFEIENQKIGG